MKRTFFFFHLSSIYYKKAKPEWLFYIRTAMSKTVKKNDLNEGFYN